MSVVRVVLWGINTRCSVLSQQHKHAHNGRKVTELLKGSIFVMHHLLKTIHVRGLEKIDPAPMSK